MYDSTKVIIGIVIFVGLFSFPIWSQVVLGTPGPPPKLELPKDKKKCVEATPYMSASHMELLDVWRDEVVRNQKRIYVNSEGKKYVMSLQNTCMDCHKTKEKFCDRCHDYLNVSPKCWECHIQPEYKQKETVARRMN